MRDKEEAGRTHRRSRGGEQGGCEESPWMRRQWITSERYLGTRRAHKGMMDSMSGLRRESKESWNGKTRSQANAVSFIFMRIVSGIKESRRGHRSLQKTHWFLPA